MRGKRTALPGENDMLGGGTQVWRGVDSGVAFVVHASCRCLERWHEPVVPNAKVKVRQSTRLVRVKRICLESLVRSV